MLTAGVASNPVNPAWLTLVQATASGDAGTVDCDADAHARAMALSPADCGPHGWLVWTVMYCWPENSLHWNLPFSAVVVRVVVAVEVIVLVAVVVDVVVGVVVGVVMLHPVNVPS